MLRFAKKFYRVLLLIGICSAISVMAVEDQDDTNQEKGMRVALAMATFAGGCFWCMEPPFDVLEGVVSTISGYTGGRTKNPSYKEVTSGMTGHAEVVQVRYDPSKVSYETLLNVFWKNIDPTVKNRQFCDVGEQYRTAIFYHSEQQKKLAQQSLQKLMKDPRLPVIYTQIVEAGTFYPAEEYHQNYYEKKPIRYKFYRYNCGRDQRLEKIWGERP